MYTIYYILYTVYYILYTIYYILYTIYYILYTIFYILYTIYYILYTIYCIIYTSWSSPSSYTCWHPPFPHRCAIEKFNWINSIFSQQIQSFNCALLRRRCLIHTSSKQYLILIGLEEAKTIPIVCACTFGIWRIWRISETFTRKTVYSYK